MRLILALGIFTVLFGCGQAEKEKDVVVVNSADTIVKKETINIKDTIVVKDTSTLDCNHAGPLDFNFSYADLEKKFGKKNLSNGQLYVEGEVAGQITTLYKDTPKELLVVWNEDKPPYLNIGSVQVIHPNSIYQFANGIKIGSSLKALVKANNEKPIRFYGFGWDYGGHIINEKEISKDAYPCFTGRLSYKGEIDQKFMGDMEKNSSMEGLPIDQIYLDQIVISAKTSQ